jgi:hypothetical protein
MSVRSLCSWISALDPGQVEKFVASDQLANPFSLILSGFDRRRALATPRPVQPTDCLRTQRFLNVSSPDQQGWAEADDVINPKAGIIFPQLPERVNDE